MGSKLYRSAPEHVRPVTAFEARGIQIVKDTPPISIIAQQLQDIQNQGTTQAFPHGNPIVSPNIPVDLPANPTNPPESGDHDVSHQGSQPDGEPEVPSSHPLSESDKEEPEISEAVPSPEGGIDIPVPESEDDNLLCECLWSIDTQPSALEEPTENLAWRCEVLITQDDIEQWKQEEDPTDLIFVASATTV